MLQSLILAKEEDITRSKEVVAELENQEITNERRNELMFEMERLTGKVLRKINDEILQDLNNLEPFFTGRLLKKFDEHYEVLVENKEKLERWGWVVTMIDGEKRMYDPLLDEDKIKYEKIPMIPVERIRTVYICETNTKQVEKIKELIVAFWEKVKGELKNVSIDVILGEKRKVELEIAAIDRGVMTQERLSELEFQDAIYIKKPSRRPVDTTERDLFSRFDEMKNSAGFIM